MHKCRQSFVCRKYSMETIEIVPANCTNQIEILHIGITITENVSCGAKIRKK
jgi:hypothetical protein